MRTNRLAILGVVVSLALAVVGCHADDNDPVGQAKELNDPIRRMNAIGNLTRLWGAALDAHNGNRNDPAVKALADQILQPLVDCYLHHPEDNGAREHIMALLRDMQDVRAIPAYKEALKWRMEVSERQACDAATALQNIDVPADKKADITHALTDALDAVTGARGVDNQMRIAFIRTLGTLHDPAATTALVNVATRQSQDQSFLINLLAFDQLAQMGDAAAIPAYIKGLYLFDPTAPQRRANDLGELGLVNVGRPSFQPLVDTLAGNNQDANTIAAAYMGAVQQANPAAATQMSAVMVVNNESAHALGELSLRDAIPTLVAEAHFTDETDDNTKVIAGARRLGAAIGLARIHRDAGDDATVRSAINDVYEKADKETRMQLLRAMQHLFDPAVQPFLLTVARTPEDELPDIRVTALNSFSLFANAAEAAQARQLIDREPGPEDGGYKTTFTEQNDKALTAAAECNDQLPCWIGKLGDRDKDVRIKAAYMIGRYGRGNAAALTALVGKLDDNDEEVRGAVLYALDFCADHGSPEGVAKLMQMRDHEEGRAIWAHVKSLALITAGRLRIRAGG